MITVIEQQTGETPRQVIADAGYWSEESLNVPHGERPGPCSLGPLPTDATRVDPMERKLQTKTGATVYAARKAIVEPLIGQIKQARGFRQFLLRGVEKVRGEWALVVAKHNVLRLYRLYSC